MRDRRDAAFWIRALGLAPHPEGGYFRETWRSTGRIPGGGALGSAIYYLLEGEEFSAFHRLRCDEIWHHHDGGSLAITMITPGGELKTAGLGLDPAAGESPQVVIPSGTWFAAALPARIGFVLVGCTSFPGFEYAGWELAEREALLREFPAHGSVIESLTRTRG